MLPKGILTDFNLLDIVLLVAYITGILFYANKFLRKSPQFFRLFLAVGFAHLFFTLFYYYYTLSNVADSIGYYRRVLMVFDNWSDTFGQGTFFIYTLYYPLVNFIGLSYFGSFFVFSFAGFLGFYYLAKILRHIANYKWTPWYYLLLMPNIHFWTVAPGKDSLIFLGITMLLYAFYFKKKITAYIVPFLLVGFIRIHVLAFIVVALIFTQIFINKNLKSYYKVFLLAFLSVASLIGFPLLLARIGVSDSDALMAKVDKLENIQMAGGSTVDLSGQNIIIKWLSYMFRPLFYDANNAMSLIVSVENLLWVFIFIKTISLSRKKILPEYRSQYWACFFAVLFITIPSAYILSNLGIAVRQKTMAIPFFIALFFIAYFKNKSTVLT